MLFGGRGGWAPGGGGGVRGWRQGLSSVRSGATADYAYFYVSAVTRLNYGARTSSAVFDVALLRLTDEIPCNPPRCISNCESLGFCVSFHFTRRTRRHYISVCFWLKTYSALLPALANFINTL